MVLTRSNGSPEAGASGDSTTLGGPSGQTSTDDLQEPGTGQEDQPEGQIGEDQRDPTPDGDDDAELDRQLQEITKKAETARKRREIERLKAQLTLDEQAAADYANGVLQGVITAPSQPITTSSVQLPKAKPPHVFEGKGRADYDWWVTDIERLMFRAPSSFDSEAKKTDLGEEWVGRDQQALWGRYKMSNPDPTLHTWAEMKRVMLDSMGTAAERQQAAHDRLKRVTQGHYSPTELLEYLKRQWNELEEKDEGRQILAFKGALDGEIKKRMSIAQKTFTRLVDVEESANNHWREILRDRKGPGGPHRRRARGESPEKEHKKPRMDQDRPERPPTATRPSSRALVVPTGPRAFDRRPPALTCWICGKEGHKRTECPQFDPSQSRDGESKGQPAAPSS